MALYGKGMLMTFTETLNDDEVDFNEWYNREHVDERVWMPGFFRARRYIDADGTASFKYFATYETTVVQDLADPEYMELLKDDSDWYKKVMAKLTKIERITKEFLQAPIYIEVSKQASASDTIMQTATIHKPLSLIHI